MPEKKYKVASFFAGCGGLDLGFEQAGFRVVWANESAAHCRATYVRNHPETELVLDDVCKISPDSILDKRTITILSTVTYCKIVRNFS